MSSKKLMAAALAAVMAVGTVSTVAFAEEGVDTWTIDGSKAGDKTFTEATINPYFSFALSSLPSTMTDNWATIKNNTKNDDNNYNKELSLAIWEAYSEYEFKDFKGGSAVLEMEGTAVEWVPAQIVMTQGTGAAALVKLVDTGANGIPRVMVPKLKDGSVIVLDDLTGAKAGDIGDQPATVQYKIATKAEVDAYAGTKAGDADPGIAGAATAVSANTKIYETTDGDLVFGESVAATDKVSTKKVTGKETETIGTSLRDSGGAAHAPETTTAGKQTATVQFTPSFEGLSDSVRLHSIDLAKSKMTIDISGTVSGKTWTNYYLDSNKKPLWTISGSKDYTWVWKAATPGEFGGTDGSAAGLKVLMGYPQQTGYAADAPNSFKANPDVKEDNEDLTIPLVQDIFTTGSLLGFGDIVPPAMLKALNEGGSIEFEFSRELKSNEYFTGAMMFGVANGAIANNFSIEPTYGNGKTATVTIPAGLTYYADEKNPWQRVGLGWRFSFQKLGHGLFAPTDNSAGTDKVVTDVKIVKMTFKTNGAAVDNNSGSTSGSTSGNNGGNTSGSKDPNGNPPTGIALAVAPVILAAGAVVAISASKKRK